MSALWKVCRWDQWWNYKMPPLCMAAYAICLYNHRQGTADPLLWIGLCLWTAGLAVMAHVINDWCDISDDEKAGKPNRLVMAGTSAGPILLLLSLLLTFSGCLVLKTGMTGCILTIGNILVFVLYSLPPFRLKGRGWLGGAADAAAAHLLPLLFFISSATSGQTLPTGMVFWTLCWSVWGLRGFLGHQLRDRENDLASGLKTTASRTPLSSLMKWSLYFLLPMETASLCLFLFLMGEPLIWFAPALYIFMQWGRCHFSGTGLTVVEPRPKTSIFLQEHYEIWLPLTFAVLLAYRSPPDLLVLLFHLILFQQRIFKVLRQCLRFCLLFIRMCLGKYTPNRPASPN